MLTWHNPTSNILFLVFLFYLAMCLFSKMFHNDRTFLHLHKSNLDPQNCESGPDHKMPVRFYGCSQKNMQKEFYPPQRIHQNCIVLVKSNFRHPVFFRMSAPRGKHKNTILASVSRFSQWGTKACKGGHVVMIARQTSCVTWHHYLAHYWLSIPYDFH